MMTASSTASTTTPPATLVMSGNGQPIIANGRAAVVGGGDDNVVVSGAVTQAEMFVGSTNSSTHSINGGARVKTIANGVLRNNNNNNNNNNNIANIKSPSKIESQVSEILSPQQAETMSATTTQATHAKDGPPAFKRPIDVGKFLLKQLFFLILHLIVTLYTYLTLPIYMISQNPSEVVASANEKRAARIKPEDPYSPWVSTFKSKYQHVVDDVETLDEMVSKLGKYFNLDRRALGARRVLREHLVLGPDGVTPQRIDGREVKKRELSDFEWISYEDMIKRRVHIARGLHLAGVNRYDKIVILCETCPEFLMMELAIAHAGAVQVNVFSTLGDDGIAHAIRETQARYIFTNFELLGKTRSIIQNNNLDVEKIFYTGRRCETPSEKEIAEGHKIIEPLGKTTFVTLEEIWTNGKIRGHEVEQQCKALGKDEIAIISKFKYLI